MANLNSCRVLCLISEVCCYIVNITSVEERIIHNGFKMNQFIAIINIEVFDITGLLG